jgi:2-oxoglutarate ferredoxin oxidoreductase subunit beta
VAFNNHPGSTKSYDYVREHNEAVNRLDFISPREEMKVTYAPGDVRSILMHDGGTIRLRKVDERYDPSDRAAAMGYIEARREAGEVVTGLLYLHADSADMHDMLDTIEAPLNTLGDPELVPGSAALAGINESLR